MKKLVLALAPCALALCALVAGPAFAAAPAPDADVPVVDAIVETQETVDLEALLDQPDGQAMTACATFRAPYGTDCLTECYAIGCGWGYYDDVVCGCYCTFFADEPPTI